MEAREYISFKIWRPFHGTLGSFLAVEARILIISVGTERATTTRIQMGETLRYSKLNTACVNQLQKEKGSGKLKIKPEWSDLADLSLAGHSAWPLLQLLKHDLHVEFPGGR